MSTSVRPAPGLIRGRLNNRKRTADHFDRIARLRIEKPGFEMHGNHKFGAELAHGRRGNLFSQKAIHQEMILVFDRKKQSGIGAGGAKSGTDFALA